jgi:hypothetical protein
VKVAYLIGKLAVPLPSKRLQVPGGFKTVLIWYSLYYSVGFEVLRAEKMNVAVFWYVALCSLAEIYQCFTSTFCIHYCPDDGGSKYL